jgi:hypothetical protein
MIIPVIREKGKFLVTTPDPGIRALLNGSVQGSTLILSLFLPFGNQNIFSIYQHFGLLAV